MLDEIVFTCPECDKTEKFKITTPENIWEMAYFLSNNGQPLCIDCAEGMVLKDYET